MNPNEGYMVERRAQLVQARLERLRRYPDNGRRKRTAPRAPCEVIMPAIDNGRIAPERLPEAAVRFVLATGLALIASFPDGDSPPVELNARPI